MLNLKYSIIDTECLEDYFSLQAKSEKSEVQVYECYSDEDCYQLYNQLKKVTRPMYFYSIDYDKVMLNALCKLVEKKETNILYHLRKINDYIIQDKLDYFRLNAEFWIDCYFYIKKTNEYMEHDEVFELAKIKIKSMYPQYHGFIDNYSHIFGKSKVFKNLIMNSIPKIYYYYNIDVNKTIKPSISLKKLQLIHEGYNIKFDFSKYTKIADIKKDGLFDKWIEYSKNDVLFLEKLFLAKPKDDITKRFYAYKAIKQINPDFEIDINVLFSENNTTLISKILEIPNPVKNFEFDYEEHIKTDHPDFNHLVSFVNQNNFIKKDKDLKNKYCQDYEKDYITDDQTIVNDDKIDLLIGSFMELIINGTKVKIGLGGCHGAIDQYIGENLIHLDYTSQYPSIILQYKEFFRNIINVDLYEAVYNLRITSKTKLSELKVKIEEAYKIIEDGGNEMGDIAEQGPQIEEWEKEKIELELIVEGLKLILNSCYGLINSNFNISIACKKLGRFICLKGQSLIINLATKLINKCPDIKLININTDGIICKIPEGVNIDGIIEQDRDGYFTLGVKQYKSIIQKDVNSYILDNKVKGNFNIKIKQNINRHERISVNAINAIRLIQNKEIKFLPIFFDTKWIDKEEKRYYFTTKENGVKAIKRTAKPEILYIDNELMYFTDDINKADKSLYKKYAEITKNKILNFTWVNPTNTNKPYVEVELIEDIDENILVKRLEKRKLYKLLGTGIASKYIGFTGYKGSIKANSYYPLKPIVPLVYYTMTQIQNSTYCQGFSLHNIDNSFIIIDIDALDKTTGRGKWGFGVLNFIIPLLREAKTFEVWNSQTLKFNHKYIFKNPDPKINYKVNDKYSKFIELIDKGVIWSMKHSERQYFYQGEFKEITPEIISELLIKY